jgi:3-oxoacyl-[acyl-carrier protein] reductase
MNFNIAGKQALVCGASRGLGFACAEALAGEGVSLTLVARSGAALDIAAKHIAETTGHAPKTVEADLSTEKGRQRVLSGCPTPDILVTNAGGPSSGDFRKLTHTQWLTALETNFLAAEELIKAAVDHMINKSFGRIVNITSMTVRTPIQGLDLSNATRLALTGYVAGVARQIAKHNVTINNLLPGPIATERLLELGQTAEQLIARVPAGRAGHPRELGAACAFLCSEQAGFITGQNLLVDGGLCSFTV